MTTKRAQMSLWIDADLWREAKRVSRQSRRLTLGGMMEQAIERRLEDWERRDMRIASITEEPETKPAGQPFPERQGRLKTGHPASEAREEGTQSRVTVRLPRDLRDRWYDAIWWQGEYLSHVTEEALRDYLKNITD